MNSERSRRELVLYGGGDRDGCPDMTIIESCVDELPSTLHEGFNRESKFL